jgi:zinc protease
MASPDVVFEDAVEDALSGGNPRRAPDTPATVDQWDLAKSMAFYKARFADASNFTFVFVGSFTPEAIKPLVETYLASLPATHAHESWRDVGIAPPSGIVEKAVQRGVDPKSRVAIVFSGPFVYDDAHVLALSAMTMVLQSRLFDTIRQELGGTYSIDADDNAQKVPRPEYTLRIEWTSDPARTTALVNRVFDEIRDIRDANFAPNQVTLIRSALQRRFEQSSQDNSYLLRELSRRYENGDAADLSPIADMPSRIAELTGAAIHDAAQTCLDLSRYVKVVLMPEGR